MSTEMDRYSYGDGVNGLSVLRLPDNGQPWFLAKDVCKGVGLRDVHNALLKLDDDERRTLTAAEFLQVSGGMAKSSRDNFDGRSIAKGVPIVTEPGVYKLALRGTTDAAKKFARWVTHEVLPSIRQTGEYVADWTTRCNNEHARLARCFWETSGKAIAAGNVRHFQGRTYVATLVDVPDQMVIGTSIYADDDHVLGRLRSKKVDRVIRVVSGGWSRECELFVALESYRTNDGIDYFTATPESLKIVQSYRWAPNGQRITDQYYLSSPPRATAIAA